MHRNQHEKYQQSKWMDHFVDS